MFGKLGYLARLCAESCLWFVARFSMRFTMRFAVWSTKILVEKRESQINLGVLGRSLSCNPLMPRDFSALINFNATQIATIKRESDLHALNQSQSPQNGAIIVDTSLQKNISLVANARCYTAFLIIHKDIFISKYQILESLVYGADCVVLSSDILSIESLESLQNYAQHLGLSVATTNKNGEIAIKSINESIMQK